MFGNRRRLVENESILLLLYNLSVSLYIIIKLFVAKAKDRKAENNQSFIFFVYSNFFAKQGKMHGTVFEVIAILNFETAKNGLNANVVGHKTIIGNV